MNILLVGMWKEATVVYLKTCPGIRFPGYPLRGQVSNQYSAEYKLIQHISLYLIAVIQSKLNESWRNWANQFLRKNLSLNMVLSRELFEPGQQSDSFRNKKHSTIN
jgi:hypothetical protein